MKAYNVGLVIEVSAIRRGVSSLLCGLNDVGNAKEDLKLTVLLLMSL